jgi:hypothetical protein
VRPATDSPPGTIAPATLIDPAIAIQVALAHDGLDGVHAQAVTLAQDALKLGPAGAEIARAASDLGRQTTVADTRTAFGEVSDALISFMQEAKLLTPEGVRTAYCPMLRKSWLQRDSAINNPYYGSKMLECGAFTK